MTDNEFKLQALLNLRPSASWSQQGGKLEWLDNEQTEPTKAEIDAEVTRLKAEYDAQEYARSRKPEYPDIGDQLDDLYHKGAFSDEMAVKIKAVKIGRAHV